MPTDMATALYINTNTNTNTGAFYEFCAAKNSGADLSSYTTSNVNFYFGGSKGAMTVVNSTMVCGKITSSKVMASIPQKLDF